MTEHLNGNGEPGGWGKKKRGHSAVMRQLDLKKKEKGLHVAAYFFKNSFTHWIKTERKMPRKSIKKRTSTQWEKQNMNYPPHQNFILIPKTYIEKHLKVLYKSFGVLNQFVKFLMVQYVWRVT